jgi:hypothetical protein
MELAGFLLPTRVFVLYGCTIAVLPYPAVMREISDQALIAEHDRSIFDYWVRRAVPRHPLAAGRELLSTSGIGRTLIRLRA